MLSGSFHVCLTVTLTVDPSVERSTVMVSVSKGTFVSSSNTSMPFPSSSGQIVCMSFDGDGDGAGEGLELGEDEGFPDGVDDGASEACELVSKSHRPPVPAHPTMKL